MESLKKQRAVIKGSITKLHNWFLANKDKEQDLFQFKIREDKLNSVFSEYEKVQGEIEVLDDTDLEMNDRNDVEQKFYNTLAGIKRKIDEFNSKILISQQQIITPHLGSSAVQLPEITIQTFYGNFSEWNAFFQLFTTLIINNTSLNDLQRFIYLKSFLKGEPLRLINNIEVIDSNFQIAINTLKDRYENNARVISILIKRLLKTPSLTKCNMQTLREFLTEVKQTIQALKNIQVPVDQWDLIHIEIFLEKVDFATHKAFEYQVGFKIKFQLQSR